MPGARRDGKHKRRNLSKHRTQERKRQRREFGSAVNVAGIAGSSGDAMPRGRADERLPAAGPERVAARGRAQSLDDGKGRGRRLTRDHARQMTHMSGRRLAGGLRLIHLNLDRSCRYTDGMLTNPWEAAWAGAREKGVQAADVIVFGEVCSFELSHISHKPDGMSMFVVSASDEQGGVLVAVRTELRPRLVWKLNNAGIELAAVSCILNGQAYLIAGFYAHCGLSVPNTKLLVMGPIESFLTDVRMGQYDTIKRNENAVRKPMNQRQAMCNAIFVLVGDANARFGSVNGGGRAFDAADPSGDLPWRSMDKCEGCSPTELRRGELWWSLLQRVGMRIVNDFDVSGGGPRIAKPTNVSDGRSAGGEKRHVETVIDIVAVGGPQGFDPRMLSNVSVGMDALVKLNEGWQHLGTPRRHALICLVLRGVLRAQRRLARPPALKKFVFHADRVDRAQYIAFQRECDRQIAGSNAGGARGVFLMTVADIAEVLAAAAEKTLFATLKPLSDVHPARGAQRELRAVQDARRELTARFHSEGASADAVNAASEAVAECISNLRRAVEQRDRDLVLLSRDMLDRGWSRNSRRFFADLGYIIGLPAKYGHRIDSLVHAGSPLGSATTPNEQNVALTEAFDKVGKKPLAEGGKFSAPPYAFYEHEAARIRAAYHDLTSDEPLEQNAEITLEELARLAKRISLGKGADASNFRGDYWHKIAVKLLDRDPAGGYGPTMHALLDALNAMWCGKHDIVKNKDWYLHRVVPIFKGGDLPSDQPPSYRDVTVTSRQEALIATIACARLRAALESSGIPAQLLDSAQHGFRAGKSCDTALFTVQSIMQRHMLSKKPLLMVFWDVRKAFPTTWRERLIVRLWERGIRGRLLHYIIHSGAMEYARYVDVPGSTVHTPFTDERGISTGHVLSPLLFLIEQDDMGTYLAADEHPGVGVDLGGPKKMAANFFADDGVGLASSSESGPAGVQMALEGMHRLLQRLEVYCDDARRELNVTNKATVIMGMNIGDEVLSHAGFMLCGENVAIVDEFKYLGTMITSKMRRPTAEFASLSGRVWQEYQQKRVDKMLPRVNAGLYSPELSARMRRQLITNWVSAAEYGAGVMVCAPWKSLTVEYNALLKRGLHLPANTQGVPAEMLWGEWGLWPLEARFRMHTLRVWSSVMCMPPESWARRAWAALVEEVDSHVGAASEGGRYTLVGRVRDVLEDIGHSADFDSGLRFVDEEADEEKTHKQLLHVWASAQWRRGMFEPGAFGKPRGTLSEHYSSLVPEQLGFCEYLEQKGRWAQIVDTRLRIRQSCLRVVTGAREGLPREGRVCEQCSTGHVEDEYHYYVECPHWAQYRRWMETSVRTCTTISEEFKHALGTMQENPGAWYRLLMCAPYGAVFESDYNVPSGKLALRISSAKWRHVPPEDVVRARRVLRDRRAVQSMMASIKVAWYLARAKLAGYDSL